MKQKIILGLVISLGVTMCAAGAGIALLVMFSPLDGWPLLQWVTPLAGIIAGCAIVLVGMALKIEGGSSIKTGAAIALAVAITAPSVKAGGSRDDGPRTPYDGIIAGAKGAASAIGGAFWSLTRGDWIRGLGGWIQGETPSESFSNSWGDQAGGTTSGGNPSKSPTGTESDY